MNDTVRPKPNAEVGESVSRLVVGVVVKAGTVVSTTTTLPDVFRNVIAAPRLTLAFIALRGKAIVTNVSTRPDRWSIAG